MKLTALALVPLAAASAAACQQAVAREPPSPLPWLHGLTDLRVVERGPAGALVDLEPDDACGPGAYAELELAADVAPPAGRETIRASYARGVTVRDTEGIVLAAAPGYPCWGSADELEVLAAGTSFPARTLVLAATSGGRREQLTWLALFRVTAPGELAPVFTGAVEVREDERVRRGEVWLLPGGLLYRPPGGELGVWIYDPVGRAYTHRGPLLDRGPRHVEGPPFT